MIPRSWCGTAVLLGTVSWIGSAQAYNWATHEQMVEAAVTSMQSAGAQAPVGSGISDPDWQSYRLALGSAVSKLNKMRTSLSATDIAIPQDISQCGYDFHSDNTGNDNYDLSQLNNMQIRLFPYYPKRPGDACTLKYIPPDKAGETAPMLREHILGKILGWHAAMVDDHKADTVLGIKPTNSAFLGAIKSVLSDIAIVGAAIILLPLYCLGSWFTGHSCHPRDAIDEAVKTDPIPYLDASVPVYGKIEEGDLGLNGITGIWHFMHVDATLNRYNEVRGMWYPGAGPFGVPGALDVAIKAASDVSGLTVNFDECDGAKNYGACDRVPRSKAHWQAFSIGDLEFSSVQSLAEYGWRNFQKDSGNAAWLGWPLHALGDSAEPHHVVGTTAWGHRPYEDAAEEYWKDMFHVEDSINAVLPTGEQLDRILVTGYFAWQLLHRQPAQTLSIRQFISYVGSKTREQVKNELDWPYIDTLSTIYALGAWPDHLGQKAATLAYRVMVPSMRPLLENGIGAMVGFLAVAATLVPDAPAMAAKCTPGTRYEGGNTPGCRAPAPPVAQPTPVSDETQPRGPVMKPQKPRSCKSVDQVCTRNKNECCDDLKCVATDEPLPPTPCPPNLLNCISIPSYVNRCCERKDPCSKDSDCCDYSDLCNPTTRHCEPRPSSVIH